MSQCSTGRLIPVSVVLVLAALLPTTAQAVSFPSNDKYVAVRQGGDAFEDSLTDGKNNGREVVGDPGDAPLLLYADGTTLFVRVRLDSSPLNAAGTALSLTRRAALHGPLDN